MQAWFFPPKNQKIYFFISWKIIVLFIYIHSKCHTASERLIPTGFDSIAFEFAVFIQILVPIDTIYPMEFKKKQKLVDAETNTSEYTILCAYPFAQLSSTYRYKFWVFQWYLNLVYWNHNTIQNMCKNKRGFCLFFLYIFIWILLTKRERDSERGRVYKDSLLRSDVFQKSIKIIFIYL